MADKTRIRELRESAGLSRSAVAKMLDTTVHHYWQVDEGTDKADPELIARAYKLLGGAEVPGGGTTQQLPPPPGLEASGGLAVWACGTCKHEEAQVASVTEMSHLTRGGKRHVMHRKIT